MTFKLSELVKLGGKKEFSSGKFTSKEGMNYWQIEHPEAFDVGFNEALSDLANMEIEVDEEVIRKIIQIVAWKGGRQVYEQYNIGYSPFHDILSKAIASQLPKMIKSKLTI